MFVFILIPRSIKYSCINGRLIYSCVYEISSAIYLLFFAFPLERWGVRVQGRMSLALGRASFVLLLTET